MMTMTAPAEYLTYAEAAREFGVAESTVRSWVRAGYLKRYRKALDKHVYLRRQELQQIRDRPPEAY